jgi:IstB-like ATP binding protein
MIVTSNMPFSAWGEIFGDDAVAVAMVDRLIHHAELISLKGDSYRLKDRDLGPRPARQPPKRPNQSPSLPSPSASDGPTTRRPPARPAETAESTPWRPAIASRPLAPLGPTGLAALPAGEPHSGMHPRPALQGALSTGLDTYPALCKGDRRVVRRDRGHSGRPGSSSVARRPGVTTMVPEEPRRAYGAVEGGSDRFDGTVGPSGPRPRNPWFRRGC